MLRIIRPREVPSILLSPEVLREKQKLLTYLRRDPDARKQRRDGLNEDMLYSLDLKEPLRKLFSDRCAFCERDVHVEGLIHHLRPLRFAETQGEPNQDHYLWLAFEWRNLFLACAECSRSKRGLFPIDGATGSYLSSFDDLVRREKSLLIDPTAIEPSRHLRFLSNGTVHPLSRKGGVTINVFDLNRPRLVMNRQRVLSELFRTVVTPADALLGPFEHSDEHIGCQVNVLKRVANLWLGAGRLPRGNGARFIGEFFSIWRESSEDDRRRLGQVVNEVQSADHLFDLGNRQDGPYVEVTQLSPLSEMLVTSPNVGNEQIATIEISNFKAIGKLKFDLPHHRSDKSGAPSLVVIGENSTGKSSLLSAVALALIGEGESRKLRDYLPALVRSASEEHFDQLDELPVEVKLGFHFTGNDARFRYDPAVRSIEGTRFPSSLVLGYGPRRYFDPKKVDRGHGSAARVRTLFDPLATIPYPGDWLRRQRGKRFDSLARALRVVLSLGDNDELVIDPERIAVRANGRVTSLDALSEGYRSVFVMTVDIIRELLDHWENLETAEAVVLIDEIETHLHPRWKMQVMTSLRRALPKVQFIVTTHDPLCLRGMDDSEVAVLQRTGNGDVERLIGLPSIKGMSAEQLLTSDYFGLVSTADPSTEIGLARAAGDVASRQENGEIRIATSFATAALIEQLTIGDSPSEQIIQEAVMEYLRKRATDNEAPRPSLRKEAVDAVLRALDGRGSDRP